RSHRCAGQLPWPQAIHHSGSVEGPQGRTHRRRRGHERQSRLSRWQTGRRSLPETRCLHEGAHRRCHSYSRCPEPTFSTRRASSPGSAIRSPLGSLHSYRLAFLRLPRGHPFLNLADVQIPMARSRVLTTLSSELASTKIVNVAGSIGTITSDHLTAVTGNLGPPPAMIPLDLTLLASGGGGSRQKTLHF